MDCQYYNEIDREKSVVFSKKELEKHLEIQSVVLKGYLDEEVIDNKVLIDEKECFAIQNFQSPDTTLQMDCQLQDFLALKYQNLTVAVYYHDSIPC